MVEITRRPTQATLIVSDQDRRREREAERASVFAGTLASMS